MDNKNYIPDKINGENVDDYNMGIKKMILASLEGNAELIEEKKVVYDKNKQQYSIKIPKSLALKAGVKPDSMLAIVFNPKIEKTLDEIKKSKLVIYFKEDKDGKRKGTEQKDARSNKDN
jgi:hypothetical protein